MSLYAVTLALLIAGIGYLIAKENLVSMLSVVIVSIPWVVSTGKYFP